MHSTAKLTRPRVDLHVSRSSWQQDSPQYCQYSIEPMVFINDFILLIDNYLLLFRNVGVDKIFNHPGYTSGISKYFIFLNIPLHES